MAAPIDYKNCSFSEDPGSLNLLGDGVTWESRIKVILEYNCSGCHGEVNPSAGLSLVGDGVYERLLEPSSQNPDMPLISPSDETSSYLFLKLIDDSGIVGTGMPFNPNTGEAERLTEAELNDIETWIINGAIENE